MTPDRAIVAVIGSGSEHHETLTVPLGKWLAKKGFYIINGGGGGVMEATARAFSQTEGRAGLTLGVLPSSHSCDMPDNRKSYQPPKGYPNPYIDLAIRTHLHLSASEGMEISSRNHIIILTADIVIALPGGAGTRSEIQLTIEYGKPLIIFDPKGKWKEFEVSPATHVKDIDGVILEMQKRIKY